MALVKKNALLPYSAEQMFALVNDVAAYPQFLPSCIGSTIHSQDQQQLTASLVVAKAGIQKSFTTQNTLHPPTRIDMALLEGPFRQLQGQWRFTPLDELACQVSLELTFEFNSKVTELLFGKVFHELVHAMVGAFCSRAAVVYGQGQ